MKIETLNVILIIVFVVLILLSLLSCFIGYKKGIYKVILKIVIKTILLTISIFTSSGLATLLGSIDIQIFIGSTQSYSLHDFIVNSISETGLFSPINGLSIYQTSIAIADSLLSYVSFLLLVILIQIITPILTSILYVGIFKNLLLVENDKDRKEKKKDSKKYYLTNNLKDENGNLVNNPRKKIPQLKVIAAMLSFVQEFIFLIVLLSPLTSLSSIIINNKDPINEYFDVADIDDNEKEKFNSCVETIDDSIIYQLISNTTLDDLIMNKVSRVSLNGVNISFKGLINSFFDVANPLIENDVISYDKALSNVTINYSALLSLQTMDSILSIAINNPMILSLIPPILDVGLNSISGNYIAINELDFINIDYKNELEIVKSFYNCVYQSSIQPMLTDDKVDFDNFYINTSSFTDEEIDKYVEAISSLGKLETLTNNIANVLSSIGSYLNRQDYNAIPSEKSAYENINWENDLRIIANATFKFLRIIDLDISSKMKVVTLKDKLIQALYDQEKRDEIKVLLCGDTNSEGLIDTDIFSKIYIGNLLENSLSKITSLKQYVKSSNISNALKNYNASDYRGEFNTVFKLLDILYDKDSKISLENIADVDLEDDETIQQLVNLLNIGKKSNIFSTLYPSILKAILFNNNFDFSEFMFGLTPYNFNYESDSFLDDFSSFLTLFPEIRRTQRNLNDSSLSQKEKLESIDIDTLNKLLNIIADSDFFNSDQLLGTSSDYQKNVNIQTFLSNLLKTSIFSNYSIVVPSLSDLQDLDWNSEINILCQILEKAKDNSSFIASENKDVNKITNRDSLTDLLELSFDSKIFSKSILEVIDTSLNDYLKDLGIQLTIDEMRNSLWKEDCDDIVSLLLLFQGIDLSSFDLKSINPNRLNAILTLLCNANFIDSIKTIHSEKFGYAFYSILSKRNTFTDLGISIPSFSIFKKDNNTYSEVNIVAYINRDIGDETKSDLFYITSKGYIKDFCDLISILQKYNLDFKNGKLPKGFITDIKEITDSIFIRGIIVEFIKNSFNNLKITSSFMPFISSIDFSLLYSETKDEFDYELDLIDYLFYLTDSKYENVSLFEYMVKNIYSLKNKQFEDTTLIEIFDSLIDKLSSSNVLKEKKDSYLLNPIQTFYSCLIEEMDLIADITLTSNTKYQSDVLKGILTSINDLNDELNLLKRIVSQIQGYDNEFKISSFSTFDDSYSLFSLLNESSIFHRVPISILKREIDSTDLSSYLYDKNNSYYQLDYYVKLDTSASSILYWDNEIYYLLKIMNESLQSIFKDNEQFSTFDLYTIDIDSSYKFSKFMYYFSKVKLFSKTRSLILYNILDERFSADTSLSLLLMDSTSNIFGVDKKVYRLEELFFLNIDNNNFTETIAVKEFDCLLNNLKDIIDYIDAIKNGSLSSFNSLSFEKMNLNCFYDNVSRSSIASEFLAGFETLLFNNSYFTFEINYSLYDNDYALINPIDGKGIDGIISFLTLEIKSFYTYDELKNIFNHFGSNSYLDYSGLSYKNSNNSNFAISILDDIKNIKVKEKENQKIVSLSSLILFDSYVETKTFNDLFNEIKDTII